jgi:hypothetical protein
MEKLNPLRVGSAMALTVAVISLVCTAAVFLFPDGMVSFVNSWVHGLDFTILKSNKPWTLGGLAYGWFGVSLTGFLSGFLFACSYNLVGNCPACSRKP